MILAALLFSGPAFADQDTLQAPRECRLDFQAVVPVIGATDVPVDTLVRVFAAGDECGNETITLNIDEGGTALDPFTVDGIAGTWAAFPELVLKPNTKYIANFSTSNSTLDMEFTTSDVDAPPPVAPTFEIDNIAATETEGQLGIFMDAQVSGTLADTSGNSTMRLVLTDRFDREVPTPNGSYDSAILWVEEDLPAEVCISATTLSPSGEESEAIVDCAVPDYSLVENPDEPAGCNCSSSSGGAAWLVLGLLPALLIRRRR